MMGWNTLRALWDERDDRYRRRRVPVSHEPMQVTPDEEHAIREYRRTEIALLPQADRQKALVELNRWTPPRPTR